MKTPSPKKPIASPPEDDVLRRMLTSPPKPHDAKKPVAPKKTPRSTKAGKKDYV